MPILALLPWDDLDPATQSMLIVVFVISLATVALVMIVGAILIRRWRLVVLPFVLLLVGLALFAAAATLDPDQITPGMVQLGAALIAGAVIGIVIEMSRRGPGPPPEHQDRRTRGGGRPASRDIRTSLLDLIIGFAVAASIWQAGRSRRQ